ncbi:MAG TPA: cytochrome o ubiquinol oxidase subunit III [Candidatus Saccharimonadales bacterium]
MAENTLVVNEKVQLEYDGDNKVFLGFWIYIMTDCVLFASLFAVYAVLHGNTFGGPSASEIFNLPYVMIETLLLLTSSFTCGLAMISLQNRQAAKVRLFFIITFILGLSFLVMEIKEFHHLTTIGDSWTRSGFLSSYFTLVGTHGLHISVGLIWMAVMIFRIKKTKLTHANIRRMKMLALFWHFLDVIWIFIFSLVYLFGVLNK